MFTIGCGYLVYPQKVNIYEGETSAQQLLRLLNENGYVGYYGGSVSSSFYLAYVADGTASAARYNNYQRSSKCHKHHFHYSFSFVSESTRNFTDNTVCFGAAS